LDAEVLPTRYRDGVDGPADLEACSLALVLSDAVDRLAWVSAPVPRILRVVHKPTLGAGDLRARRAAVVDRVQRARHLADAARRAAADVEGARHR